MVERDYPTLSGRPTQGLNDTISVLQLGGATSELGAHISTPGQSAGPGFFLW